MSLPLYKNTKFLSLVNKFYKEHFSRIVDIVLFGSVIKGKEKPKDVDILVVYKDKEDLNLNYELKQLLSQFRVEVTSRTYISLFDDSFIAREAYLEGYSLVRKGWIAKGLGFSELILLKYSLDSLSKSDKVRFYYSLYGRNKSDSGMVAKLNLIKPWDGVLAVNLDKLDEAKDYLRSWKISFLEIPCFIPSRIVRSSVFRES